jgi:Subtilase family
MHCVSINAVCRFAYQHVMMVSLHTWAKIQQSTDECNAHVLRQGCLCVCGRPSARPIHMSVRLPARLPGLCVLIYRPARNPLPHVNLSIARYFDPPCADDYTSSNTPVPDDDPRDTCDGHGTHVAGIVGAKGKVTGVAPGITFGAYRVLGCKGGVGDDVLVAALERALEDDMDVINMSLGTPYA